MLRKDCQYTFKDKTMINDRHHLFNTPRKPWIVEPNIAVRHSRSYFPRPKVKEKIAVWLRETIS